MRSTTPALLLCAFCIAGAGPMVACALPVAAVLCPAASSLATLRLPGPQSAGAPGSTTSTTTQLGDAHAAAQRSAYVRGALTYWALSSAAIALSCIPWIATLWAWLPLRRRLLLAATLHLQLMGSAPRLARAVLIVAAETVLRVLPGSSATDSATTAPPSALSAANVEEEWRPRTRQSVSPPPRVRVECVKPGKEDSAQETVAEDDGNDPSRHAHED